jgi:hypothetical protein
MKTIYIKVAVGFAVPKAPKATIHGKPIPAGYACVGGDEVLSRYDSLELDIPGDEGGADTGRSNTWCHCMEKGMHRVSKLDAKATDSSE